MAQKDIQAIAEYMNQIDESKIADDKAYEDSLQEEAQFRAEDDEALEQEIIDPASMGFIDDADNFDEADSFYAEDEQQDSFEEDVSDCIDDGKACIDEAEGLATLTIEVYNEDGFGKHFVQDIMKTVPGVEAKAMKKPAPNGDIIVKVTGQYDDLVKAFNFYIGNSLDSALSGDDKDEFNASLVFADGDTIAEADYREAVAHCLDPIGVNASTANLVKKDTCALSLVKEEKCKRKAKKFLKALQEDDLSELSDLEVDTLDSIKDAIDNQTTDELEAEDARIWAIILDQMGYTQEQWDKMTPEQQDKAFTKAGANNPKLARTGFADYFTGVDPKDHSKKYRFQKAYGVSDPENDYDVSVVAFNPDYSAEDSLYQHPNAFKKAAAKLAKAEDTEKRRKMLAQAIKDARGKDTWTKQDFARMIFSLDEKDRKALYKSLLADIESSVADPVQAANETMFIRNIFGKKPTLRNLGQAYQRTFPGVKLYADYVEGALYTALRNSTGITNDAEAAVDALEKNPDMRKKFVDAFELEMNTRKSRGDMSIDPERDARKLKIKQELKQA